MFYLEMVKVVVVVVVLVLDSYIVCKLDYFWVDIGEVKS